MTRRGSALISVALCVGCLAQSQDQPPQTTILRPSQDLYLQTGMSFEFKGEGTDPEGESLDYFWEFCADFGTCRQEGKSVDFAFQEPGIYDVVCYAKDALQEDPTPARVRVFVYEDNVPPRVRIDNQPRRTMFGYVGQDLVFHAAATDADDDPTDLFWTFLDRPGFVIEGEDMVWAPPAPGVFVIAAHARDDHDAQATDFRVVVAVQPNTPLPALPEITSIEDRQVLTSGSSITLDGHVLNPDGRQVDVWWQISDGRRYEGETVEGVRFARSGRYAVRMIVFDGRAKRVDSVDVFVVSPDVDVDVTITQPATDVLVQPGQPVFFEGAAGSGSVFEKYYRWDITKAGFDGVWRSIHIARPGEVVLPEGEYDVTLSIVNPVNQRRVLKSDPRHMVVRRTQDSDFVDNTSLDRAAAIVPGRYANLRASDGAYFKFQVPRAGQTIQLEVAADGENLRIELFGPGRQSLVQRALTGAVSLQYVAPAAGTYYARVQDASTNKGQPIGFGMGISVLNPALYFPDVQWNAEQGSRLVIVNPQPEAVSLEVAAYTSDGHQIASVPLDLEAKGRLSSSVESLFGDDAFMVSWMRVDASAQLVGMCLVESRDDREAYAVGGSTKLSSELYVPHIAQQVDQWYTRAKVANGVSNDAVTLLRSRDATKALALNGAFAKIDFDFLDLFDGSLPEDVVWGTFNEERASLQLAAIEVFGKKDGSRQVAGLGLNDARQDNPNFFFISKNMYFTHVARDTNQFWTGMALVNIDSEPRAFKVIARDPEGAILGEGGMLLDSGEKIVATADLFLDGIADVSQADWIEIESDDGLVGYELFGTHDNKRLAGLEASSGLRESICMPFIDRTTDFWYGISVVNAGTESADVDFVLYDDAGVELARVTRTLAAKQKFVDLLSPLFGGIPDTAGWVECRSDDGLLTGFQLFGDARGEKMAAILAQ